MAAQSDYLLAIVLSPKRVTAAELRLTDGEVEVSALGDIAPPEGAFDGFQVGNGEILGRAISEFMAEKNITARDAVMFLPEAAAITQLIKLPDMPREDLIGAVRAVAERYAVFAERSIAVDCAVAEELDEDGKQMLSVLFAASRDANVEQCQECARAAGLELISVEAAPAAVARACRDRFSPSEVVALAVIGETKTDVMIFDDGICRICYSANVGVPEQMAGGDWMTPAPSEHDPFVPPPQLYSELTHCFRFFQNQFPRRAVQRVLIAVDHPKAEALASHLAEQLQLPVELGRSGLRLRLPTDVNEGAAAVSRAYSLALIHGSALSALTDGDALFPINLLPEVSTFWLPARPYIKASVAIMAVVLALTVIWALSLSKKITRKEQTQASLGAQIARLEPELAALRAAQATEIALRNEVERQTARIAKQRAVRWSQILVDVSERLPRDMWLTRMASPDSSRITLNGIATNRETIPNAIEALSTSPYLDNAVLGSLSKDDTYAPGRNVIRYQIKAKLLRGLLPPPLEAEDASKPEAAEAETGSAAAAESESASEEQADATSGTQEEEE